MKSFAIAGGNFTSDGGSALYFVDIKANSFTEPALNISNLSADSVPGKALTSPYRLTSVAARPDDELLAVSNEGGEVVFYDLNAGKTVHQVRADATGVNQIVFNPAGQLLSIGNSLQSPAKLWDLRLRQTEKSCLSLSAEPILQCDPSGRNDAEPSSSSKSTSGSSKKNATFSRSTSFKTSQYNLNSITCVATHPSQSAAFFGSYLGSIYYWDLRINKFIEYKAHSSIGKSSICLT
jgi:WD40 repeat protein